LLVLGLGAKDGAFGRASALLNPLDTFVSTDDLIALSPLSGRIASGIGCRSHSTR
jgi:hypothetical protein